MRPSRALIGALALGLPLLVAAVVAPSAPALAAAGLTATELAVVTGGLWLGRRARGD